MGPGRAHLGPAPGRAGRPCRSPQAAPAGQRSFSSRRTACWRCRRIWRALCSLAAQARRAAQRLQLQASWRPGPLRILGRTRICDLAGSPSTPAPGTQPAARAAPRGGGGGRGGYIPGPTVQRKGRRAQGLRRTPHSTGRAEGRDPPLRLSTRLRKRKTGGGRATSLSRLPLALWGTGPSCLPWRAGPFQFLPRQASQAPVG